MKHLGTRKLETERLFLRQFERKDIIPSFNNWTSDSKVTEFLRWKTHESIKITEDILNEWIKEYKNKDFYQWAIILKEEGDEPIGTISVVSRNDAIKMVHIGYCIGSKWWNKGITSEAFSRVISYFFEDIKVNRIETMYDPNNINSGKVMIKCGLKYEGILRQADISNRGIVDAVVYSILANEYWKKNSPSIEI